MNDINSFFNTGNLIIFGVVFFIGLCFGWFFRKGNIILIFIAILFFGPILDTLIQIDHWLFTAPFILGFFVHTAKPIYRKISP